ncbi:MAG: hypothetical protein V7459_10815 [Oceanicoccus sp.]
MKIILTTLIVTLISLNSFADDPHDKRMNHMSKQLDLSEEQTEQIQTIFESKKEKRQAIHEQMKALRSETNSEISATLNDEQREKFEKMQQKINKKRNQPR